MTSATNKKDDDKRSGLGAQTAGRSLSKVVRRAFGRQGFAEPGILLRWPEIVGDTLSRFTLPERLTFPQGERNRGTLHLKVDGQFALEVQHLEPLIIERINGFFGYGAVARISILQAPIPQRTKRKTSKSNRNSLKPPVPEGCEPTDPDEESLDDALRRLAAHVLSEKS